MNNILIVAIIVSVPLLLAIILIARFRKTRIKDVVDHVKIKSDENELERLSQLAVFKEAQIVSVHPDDLSKYNPDERIMKLRLAVKTGENKFMTQRTRWKIDKKYVSDFRQGKMIRVKVYEKYVFPTLQGARLIPDSVIN